MKISSVALGSLIFTACLGAPAHADDGSSYLCPGTVMECVKQAHKTDGTIPADAQPSQVLHVAKYASFAIRKKGAKTVLQPESPEWLPQFYELELTWSDKGKLMPYSDCPAPGHMAFMARVRVTTTLPDTYSNFKATKPPELHVNDDLNGLQPHNLYIFPIDPNTSSDAKFCVWLPKHGEGDLHDGAVHTD